MKDSEFIALLNLYIDHEIGAGDAARLEAEVAASPARREVYRQYCRMHKACTLLAGQFQETEASARTPAVFPRRRDWAAGAYAAGLALAACVAVAIAIRSHSPAPRGGPAAARQPAPADVAVIAPGGYRAELQPVLAMRDLGLGTGASALTARANPDDSLAWVARLQMQALQQLPASPVNFRTAPMLQSPDLAGRPSPQLEAPAEMAAFHFER